MSLSITIILLIASLAVHEYAHIFAVRFLGGKIESAGLFPLGFFAKARRLETLCAWERYVIFAAGPTANFAIAAWAFSVSHISYIGVGWLNSLAFYNVVLGIFNLTPALPLDGGRIALQFLGNRIGILRASRIIKRLGICIAWVFILIGVVQMLLFPFNITLFCAGIFLRNKNKNIAPELQAAFHAALTGKESRARTLPIKEVSLPAETEIKHALERLAGDYFIVFRVGTGEKKRPLREQTLLEYVFKNGMSGT
ncbi:MAG: site-2 protease family protein, partial [Defluviitaleaceae bacterium]|nr:site-2 protease family protein [Defluviitaleaceae bacterium]